MTKPRILLSTLFLAALALQTLGCGSSTMATNRVLQSMVIMPTNPDAQNFPNGQVQFTATGTFSKAPSPDTVTFQAPYSGGWGLQGAGAANIATINNVGMAQCVPGASGQVEILAFASANAPGTAATSALVNGTTTLTCP